MTTTPRNNSDRTNETHRSATQRTVSASEGGLYEGSGGNSGCADRAVSGWYRGGGCDCVCASLRTPSAATVVTADSTFSSSRLVRRFLSSMSGLERRRLPVALGVGGRTSMGSGSLWRRILDGRLCPETSLSCCVGSRLVRRSAMRDAINMVSGACECECSKDCKRPHFGQGQRWKKES